MDLGQEPAEVVVPILIYQSGEVLNQKQQTIHLDRPKEDDNQTESYFRKLEKAVKEAKKDTNTTILIRSH